MADENTLNATLELVYVPDTYTETERQEGASWPLGSGFYSLVVVAGDARIPLHTFKAGAIDKLLAQGRQRASDRPAASPEAGGEGPAATEQARTDQGTTTEETTAPV